MIDKFFAGRLAYLFGFLMSLTIFLTALSIQIIYKLEPCPLCISQRIALMSLAGVFLLGLIHNPQTRLWINAHALLQLIVAFTGATVAIRHWWIQAHKAEMIVDCGVDFDYMFDNFPLKKALTLVFRGTGDCAAIDWTFLGLSIPQLALIAFLSIAAYAVLLAKKRV
jgi:disulfide bond formation protein DsbB